MGDKANLKGQAAGSTATFDRSQAVVIAVGMAIVLGGLWLLYQSEGPYHPEGPLLDNQVQLLGSD